jgi:diguanylate cyclase (GGDEF)-like protein/PAS domain S-box-containing protein
VVVLGLVMVSAAALAGWSWLSAAQSRIPFGRRAALALTAWAGLSAAGRLAGVFPGQGAQVIADLLLLAAAWLALAGAAGIMNRLTVARSGLATHLTESALVASSVATLAWVFSNAPAQPGVLMLLQAAPAVVDLAVAALVIQVPLLVHESVLLRRYRRRLALCAGAVFLVAAGDGVQAVRAITEGAPHWTGAVLLVAGYLVAAIVPRIGEFPAAPSRSTHGLRVLPYVLVGSAVTAVCAQSLWAGPGTMQVLLLTSVVASLIALQAFALRQNAELVMGLRSSRQRLDALVENTSDLIVRLDTNGRIVAANAAAVRLLHRTPASLIGRSFDDLAQAEDRRQVREAVLDVTRGKAEATQVELRLNAPATGTAQLRLRQLDGGAVANLNDITDSVELRQRLERMARYDQMTGLVNRAHLLDVVGSWLTEDEPDVVILYADLDGFKAVNDRFGHGAGDRVLIEVASRFEALAGALDARRAIVGRVGGDEFVMGLEGIRPQAARLAAQRVVEAITPSFSISDRTVQLGVSVGLAGVGPQHGYDVVTGNSGASELVHRADLAMYDAKTSRRSQVGQWDPELEERIRRRVDIAIGLRTALDTGRLAVAYQPIVRLSDGVVVGAEALLRLPPGVALAPGLDDLVSPAELVAVAEDTGTITEMGEWVLTQAAQQAAEWLAAGYRMSMSVNMSVQQLVQPGFVDSVSDILRECELPAGQLVLELTESQLAGQVGPSMQALERLREAGIRLAIDDFGTGYSSLSYLRRMPVQLVKIDRTLLDDVGSDLRATALVRSVVSMARDLGLLVVAEGMEDMDSVRVLRDLGAYAGQGYALSPALPPDQMMQVLAGPRMEFGITEAGLGEAMLEPELP